MTKPASSKYQPLTVHLRAQRGKQVGMSFTEIERVIGAKLPASANSHRAWWSNNPSNNVMTKAWLDAGFESEQVDLQGRKLVFRRTSFSLPPAGSAKLSTASEARGVCPNRLALFGWLKGTIVAAPNADLTDPADPEWAKRIDDEYPPAA